MARTEPLSIHDALRDHRGDIHINVYSHDEKKLDHIMRMLERIVGMERSEIQLERTLAMNLDDILTQVEDEHTHLGSMETLLAQIHDELLNAKNDPAKIQQIADALQANMTEIDAAVVANTDTPPPAPQPSGAKRKGAKKKSSRR